MADIELPTLSQTELDDKPWKYIGYMEFARFVSSDDECFVVRRFNRLHSRLLLTHQDHLYELEEKLDSLDAALSERNAQDVDNGSVRNDTEERKNLLNTIRGELEKYDSLLCHYLQLKAVPEAQANDVRDIRLWLSNRNYPIHPKEVEFLKEMDLISVAARRKSPLRRIFEQKVLIPCVWISKGANREPSLPSYPTTIYIDDGLVDALMTIAVFVSAAIMLIAPLWILSMVEETARKLGVITALLLVFLSIMSWGTFARPFEVFAATAGYSAVLVVFLQLGT